jgi:hypothetical protein
MSVMTDPQDPFAPPPPGAQPPQQPYGTPPPPPPYGAPAYGEPLPYGTAPAGQHRNGMGVAALVLGILSLLCGAVFVIPAVLALEFGLQGRKRAKRGEATNGGMALAGVIMGGISLLFAAFFYAVVLMNIDQIKDYVDCLDVAGSNSDAQQVCQQQLEDSLFE